MDSIVRVITVMMMMMKVILMKMVIMISIVITLSLSLSLVPFHTKIVHPNNKKIIKTACGAEFSMFIDDTNLLYSFGRPEHGQLGHNTDGQYFVTSNKLAFYCEVLPRHVAVFVEKTKDGFTHIMDDVKIVDVSCGNNHTVRK